MNELEMIAIDVLMARIRVGDHIVLKNPDNQLCDVCIIEPGRFAMRDSSPDIIGALVPVAAVKIALDDPTGRGFFIVPMEIVETDLDICQLGRNKFEIILTSRARKNYHKR